MRSLMFQSLIERTLYVVLLLTLIVNIGLGVLLYANLVKVQNEQAALKLQQTEIRTNTALVISNQGHNKNELLTYWSCLLKINPNDRSIQQNEALCLKESQ